MRVLRVALAAVLTVMLLGTALAVPVTAGSGQGKLAIVQGYVGKSVDVCINGVEVRSRMTFGQVAYRRLAAGAKMVKVYAANPRTCKGTQLAKAYVKLPAGSDKTIVIAKWLKPRQVLIFNNKPPKDVVPAPIDRPSTSYLVFRHAADDGVVTFRHYLGDLPGDPVAPANGVPAWKRGDESWRAVTSRDGDLFPWAITWVSEEFDHWPGTIDVAGPRTTRVGAHARYELIYIGRGYKTKLVLLKRGQK